MALVSVRTAGGASRGSPFQSRLGPSIRGSLANGIEIHMRAPPDTSPDDFRWRRIILHERIFDHVPRPSGRGWRELVTYPRREEDVIGNDTLSEVWPELFDYDSPGILRPASLERRLRFQQETFGDSATRSNGPTVYSHPMASEVLWIMNFHQLVERRSGGRRSRASPMVHWYCVLHGQWARDSRRWIPGPRSSIGRGQAALSATAMQPAW